MKEASTGGKLPPKAARLEGMGLSPIRAMSVGAPEDCLSLGLGEPTWELPEAGLKALGTVSKVCSYGPNPGTPELRGTLSEYFKIQPDQLMLTSGSQAALFALFLSYLGPGTQALLPDPGFVSYASLTKLAQAEAVLYPLTPDGWLDADAFVAALDAHPRIALAVLNNPSNPTGGGAAKAQLEKVAAACEARGILLISDEVYRELYLEAPQTSLREVSDYGIVTGSLSKAWAAPGLRVGWAVGDPRILEPARLVHNSMVTTIPRPSQAAAIALIENSGSILPQARQEIRSRWEALSAGLKARLGIGAQKPAGAFYYWLSLPPDAGDALSFCLRLRDEARVILIPGTAFGPAGAGKARLSYAAYPELIGQALARLEPYWRKS